MYLPSYSPLSSSSSSPPKKFPSKVIVSVTTHGNLNLLTKDVAIERSKRLERVTFRSKTPNAKVIIVNAAPIGSLNYLRGEDATTCNTKLLEEFEKHVRSKNTNRIVKSINGIFKRFFLSRPSVDSSPSVSSTSTTHFVGDVVPYMQEYSRYANFDLFKTMLDELYTSQNIEITKENIRKRILNTENGALLSKRKL